MINEYFVQGEVTNIIIDSPKYGRFVTLIDTEDLEMVKKASCWIIKPNRDYSYYVRGLVGGKHIYLHRYILGVTNPKILVDHIHRNPLDNRKSMLREVTPMENRQNSEVREDNKSGHSGVNWHKASGKWYARIMLDGKRISLGLYDNVEDAIEARKKAEKEYFTYLHSITKEGK